METVADDDRTVVVPRGSDEWRELVDEAMSLATGAQLAWGDLLLRGCPMGPRGGTGLNVRAWLRDFAEEADIPVSVDTLVRWREVAHWVTPERRRLAEEAGLRVSYVVWRRLAAREHMSAMERDRALAALLRGEMTVGGTDRVTGASLSDWLGALRATYQTAAERGEPGTDVALLPERPRRPAAGTTSLEVRAHRSLSDSAYAHVMAARESLRRAWLCTRDERWNPAHDTATTNSERVKALTGVLAAIAAYGADITSAMYGPDAPARDGGMTVMEPWQWVMGPTTELVHRVDERGTGTCCGTLLEPDWFEVDDPWRDGVAFCNTCRNAGTRFDFRTFEPAADAADVVHVEPLPADIRLILREDEAEQPVPF